MLKLFFKEYLDFSKKERYGIYTLLLLILFFTIIPFFYSRFIPENWAAFHVEFPAAGSHAFLDNSSSLHKSRHNGQTFQSCEESKRP